MSIQIGNISLNGQVVLAPMSGVTDLAFRRCVDQCGASMVVSEMVASHELVKARPDVVRRAEGAGLQPFVLQLAGREVHWMAEGARLAEQAGADIIDINMGCPSRQVTGGLSGSALMRDLYHASKLIEATVNATSRPVTLKMRLGWDDDTLNAPELAHMAEDLGVQLITVHGRTRCQFYKGSANWHAVRQVCDRVHIPVLVNGDIVDTATARLALEQSGADGVMIGRASVGKPWLLAEVDAGLRGLAWKPPSAEEKAVIFDKLYRELIELYDEGHGVRMARKHVAGFVNNHLALEDDGDAKLLRAEICRLDNAEQVRVKMQALFALEKFGAAA